jgi:hypothetical protein
MTYVYRGAEKWDPVHEPKTPLPPKRKPKPLPEPIWGGPLGLALAAAEVHAWERLHPAKQRREEGKHS